MVMSLSYGECFFHTHSIKHEKKTARCKKQTITPEPELLLEPELPMHNKETMQRGCREEALGAMYLN